MSIPERSSEGEDSFIDEGFGDSKGISCRDRVVAFVVDFFVDQKEDIVREGEEGSWRLSELRNCRQRESEVSPTRDNLLYSSTYLHQVLHPSPPLL